MKGAGPQGVRKLKKGMLKRHPVRECPACRGKHKAHTCGKGRNAMLERLAGGSK